MGLPSFVFHCVQPLLAWPVTNAAACDGELKRTSLSTTLCELMFVLLRHIGIVLPETSYSLITRVALLVLLSKRLTRSSCIIVCLITDVSKDNYVILVILK